MRDTLVKIAFYAWLLLIFIFSVIPNDADSSGLFLFDMSGTGFWKHVIAYFIASAMLIMSYKNESVKFFLNGLFMIFLGSILIEIIQYLLPYRSFSLGDMVANLLGITLFYGPFWIYSVSEAPQIH